MKKYFLLLLISFFVFPCIVNASYTMGDFVSNQTTGNAGVTIHNNGSNCNGALCTVNNPVASPFKVTCGDDTSCFIKFPAVPGYINNAQGNFQLEGQVLQIYAGGRYNICEIDQGIATCLIPANQNVTYVEFKYNNIYTTMAGILWYEMYEIQVFKQPGDIAGLINNINTTQNLEIQQQQQQHQEIMENNPSSYNSGIENIASNTQLPNNSGLFDVLSSLSSFVGNLSASGSCTAISVPIPFTNQNLRLPCMTTEVYYPNFPEILAIWQLIVRGIVYYYIIVNMLKLLKDTIDPFSMKLEVLDL